MNKLDPRLAALAAGNFAHATATMGTVGLLNEISSNLEVSIAAAGQLTSAMQATAAIAAPLVAFFGGAVRQRTVLLAALALTAVCQFFAALAPTFLMLLLARAVAGLGAAAYVPTAAATASQLIGAERRGSALALVYAGITLSTVAGVPLGVWLGGMFGWRTTMAGFGVLAVLAFLWVLARVPSDTQRGMRRPRDGLREMLRNPALVVALAFSLAQATGQMMFYAYIAPLLRDALSAGPGTIGLALGWAGLCGAAGSVLTIRAVDKLGPSRLLTVGMAGIVATLLLWPFAAGSMPMVLLLLGLWGACSIVLFSGQQALVVHLDPRLAATTLPMLSCATFAGGVVGPALGGVIITASGLGALPWAAAGAFALSALALAVVARLARGRTAAKAA